MTAMLGCDGCGTIVAERADDEDPTAAWWALSPGPSIGGGLLPALSVDLTVDDGHELADPEELPGVEPPRHFCSLPCVGSWVQRAVELSAHPPPP